MAQEIQTTRSPDNKVALLKNHRSYRNRYEIDSKDMIKERVVFLLLIQAFECDVDFV